MIFLSETFFPYFFHVHLSILDKVVSSFIFGTPVGMGIFFCIVFQGYFKFSCSYITLLLLSHIYCDSVSKFSNTTNQQLHIIATTTLLYRDIFLTLNIVHTYSLCSILKNTDHWELLCNQLYRTPEILK
jgi:hypothetical protein